MDQDPAPRPAPRLVLHFSRNPNPRLAVAVARHLGVALDFRFAAPFDPACTTDFAALNPSRRIPILTEPGRPPLWEADAIACRLSQVARSSFWRQDEEAPEMIRWLSWGKENFVRACDIVHFERGTKQRYHIGPVDEGAVAAGLALFAQSAAQLDRYLCGRDWLVPGGVSHADFRMACFLPFNDAARLPLADYPAIQAWSARLCRLTGWADPFAGLAAPPLPAAG